MMKKGEYQTKLLECATFMISEWQRAGFTEEWAKRVRTYDAHRVFHMALVLMVPSVEALLANRHRGEGDKYALHGEWQGSLAYSELISLPSCDDTRQRQPLTHRRSKVLRRSVC